MKIIFAQGNPGSEFRDTRHNVGFRVIDNFAQAHAAEFAEKTKFHAYIAEFSEASEKILLVKPTTYYNDTGVSARALVDFYKLDAATDLLVLHDDMALPLGTIRTREKGSDAGNNGIKSLNAHLGSDYKRARIGIWTELSARMEATAFVLGKFTAEEKRLITDLEPLLSQAIDGFISESFVTTSYTTDLPTDA